MFAVCVPGYYYEGFLAIQRAADLSIMSELGGASVQPTLTNVDVRLKSFPYPPYDDEPFEFVKAFLPLIMLMCFIYIGVDICNDVSLEKEKKLKAGFCLVGAFFSRVFESPLM